MDEKTIKEMYDVLEKYRQLEEQKSKPSKEGMIKALVEARDVAPNEIITLEKSQGDTVATPADQILDEKLYWKLSQYQRGLLNYCINKYGEEIVKKHLEIIERSTSRF